MLLYIVRHGIPDYEHDCITEDGVKQAEAVAKRLVRSGIDEVYSSPLNRARQTAEPTCRELGLEMKILPFASEVQAAKYFSVRSENFQFVWAFKNRPLFLGSDECYRNPSDFGRGYYLDDDVLAKEGARHLKEESDAFLKSLGYEKLNQGNAYRPIEDNDKRVAVFCHQGLGLHWIAYLMNLPFHLFTAGFNITHSSVSILHFRPEKSDGLVYPMCLCLSDISHLYAENLPMLYGNHEELRI